MEENIIFSCKECTSYGNIHCKSEQYYHLTLLGEGTIK